MESMEWASDTVPVKLKKDCPLCIKLTCGPWYSGSGQDPPIIMRNSRPERADLNESKSILDYSDTMDLTVSREIEDVRIRLSTFENRVDNLEKQIYDRLETRLLPGNTKRKSIAGGANWKSALADRTTIHGLKELLTEHHKSRFSAWAIIFVTALACTTLYMTKVWVEYRENPTATKVEILRQDEYEYPIVLLCPDWWLDPEKAFSMNLSQAGLQYALGFLINYGVSKAPYIIINHDQAKYDFEQWWYSGAGSHFKTLADFFKYFALDTDDFVKNCSYCENVTEWPLFAKIIMNQGVCYNLSLTPADGRVALSELDYLHVKMPHRSGGLLSERSYWRFIVNPDVSLGMSDTHFLQVFPNHSNTIRVMTHHFKSLPNANCVTGEYVRQHNYSQSTCVADCFTTARNECHPYPLVRSNNIPKNVTTLCNTAYLVAENVTAPESQIIDTPPDCIEKCPSLCEKWVYESSIESHKLDMEDEGLTSFNFLNQAVHYGGILSHEEVPTYSFETLISNIGGQMGLWLGASLMSWVELVMFLLTCTCTGLRSKFSRKKPTENNLA